ncbi:hypothetical protein A3C28_03300 [Candidatus Roizmanbacteria bacterium RIFCSPHIGHO2_02_FULL_39_9]|uniref:Malonyl-CoA:ACP transacylase (MAT) domain-containing protein n=1 Tax=Candidatus Roizmanbacteria bacterium RIFCSPHIGHO2_02_FULL_39_9 TaxID=1802040 RepID=A0A1F7HAW7_9BACT|nr:MAG: hypothetical protein A3C28_03300 [Candidatus Roizmanbacteria bacterium RIFCSPHIGHO2_02_FULL_39_9]
MLIEPHLTEIEPNPSLFAVAFPGQGAYKIDAAKILFNQNEVAKNLLGQASLIDELGTSFVDRVLKGDVDELTFHRQLQPFIVLTNIAMFEAARQRNKPLQEYTPSLYLGHSLGELCALVASGVLDLNDCLRIAKRREELMRSLEGVGMTWVPGFDVDSYPPIREASGAQITVINRQNSFFIGGTTDELTRAEELLDAEGAMPQRSDIPALSHHPRLEPVLDDYGNYLTQFTFQKPTASILMNAGSAITEDPGVIRELMVRQLVEPVNVPQMLEQIKGQGLSKLIEFGTADLWSSLVKKSGIQLRGFTNPTDLSISDLPTFL